MSFVENSPHCNAIWRKTMQTTIALLILVCRRSRWSTVRASRNATPANLLKKSQTFFMILQHNKLEGLIQQPKLEKWQFLNDCYSFNLKVNILKYTNSGKIQLIFISKNKDLLQISYGSKKICAIEHKMLYEPFTLPKVLTIVTRTPPVARWPNVDRRRSQPPQVTSITPNHNSAMTSGRSLTIGFV